MEPFIGISECVNFDQTINPHPHLLDLSRVSTTVVFELRLLHNEPQNANERLKWNTKIHPKAGSHAWINKHADHS